MKNNSTVINAFTSVMLQLVMILNGFIIPKIILINFGSEVNGLISSLTQFLNYISLIEGGVTSVIMANLYKPLAKNDIDKISSIVKTSKNFFKKIGYIFFAYTLVLAVIYPLIFKTSFSFEYIFFIIMILSFTLYIQNNFSISLKLLLTADKKVWIVSLTQMLLIIMNLISFVLFANVIKSIHLLKLITALIFILQPIIYSMVVKKLFNLKEDVDENTDLLKNRWSGFAINIAAFMHYNTDVTVLTFFTNLKVVSVYSVYSLVSNGLRSIILSFSSGVAPTIGHLYAKGNFDELNKKLSLYEYTIFFIVFLLFSVGGLLINPFVQIYTSGITDIDYHNLTFGILIILSEAIYCIKEPYVAIAYAANKFNEIKIHAYIEALINIILSIVFVNKFGLIGVSIGTIVAMTYRTLFHVYYLKKNILYRSMFVFFDKLLKFGFATFVGIIICLIIPLKITNLFTLALAGFSYSIILFVSYFLLSVLFYKKELNYFADKFLKKDLL